MRPLLLATLAAAFLPGTLAQAADDRLADWPDWVRDAMHKELKKPKARKVKTADGQFRSKLTGKPAAPETMDNGWYFASDMRADSPLECYYFTNAMDLASLTSLIADSNIEAVAANHGTVGMRRVFHTEAGELAGMPYLALEWLYTIEGEAQTLVGFTKVRAATKGDAAFACAHNNLGYRETFADAFAGFVREAEYTDDEATPYFEEIARVDMNGTGAGITYASFTLDEDGDIRMYLTESSLTPVDAATLYTSDSTTVTFTTPDGELINTVDVNVENGDLVSSISLQRGDTGDWESSGTLQGKDIEFVIDGVVSPTTEVRQLEITRNLFAGDGARAVSQVWLPSVDPTRFLEATMVRDDTEVERQARMTLGPMTYTGRFDEDGNMIDADMSMGPLSVNIARVWSRGSVRQ